MHGRDCGKTTWGVVVVFVLPILFCFQYIPISFQVLCIWLRSGRSTLWPQINHISQRWPHCHTCLKRSHAWRSCLKESRFHLSTKHQYVSQIRFTNKTQRQLCKRLGEPLIPFSWSCLVWKRVSLWMWSLGGSQQPFSCVLGHFQHGDKQTNERTTRWS